MIGPTMDEPGAAKVDEELEAGHVTSTMETEVVVVADETIHVAELFIAHTALPHIIAAGLLGALAMDLKMGDGFNFGIVGQWLSKDVYERRLAEAKVSWI